MSSSGSTCKACGKGFTEGVQVQALGGKWHQACFACKVCKTPITAASFAVKDGFPLCDNCAKKGSLDTTTSSPLKCTACGKGITSRYVKPDGKPFHKECFVCMNGCGAELVKGYVIKNGKYICGDCGPAKTSAPAAAPAASKPKFCGECGSKSTAGKFCGDCGASF